MHAPPYYELAGRQEDIVGADERVPLPMNRGQIILADWGSRGPLNVSSSACGGGWRAPAGCACGQKPYGF